MVILPLSKRTIIKRIDDVLNDYESWYQVNGPLGGAYSIMMSSIMENSRDIQLYTRLYSIIEQYAPKNSIYYNSIQPLKENVIYCTKSVKDVPPTTRVNHTNIIKLGGILKELRSAYKNGYINKIEDIINAKVFSDYLDMADYFLNEDYVDAAAIVIGCALEQHIKQLCIKNNIELMDKNGGKEKKHRLSTLNDLLVKKKIYDSATHDEISSWIKVRNGAAHGVWNKHPKDKVERMLDGTWLFIKQYP